MKIHIYIFVLVSLFGFLLSSCEEMVSNVDVPDYTPKLVVFSYISPTDSIVIVKVKKSSPVFGTHESNPETYTVSNATVVMSDGVKTVTLPYIENYYGEYEGVYIVSQRDFAVVAGKTYTLNVSSPGGFNVSSSCTVPGSPDTEVAIDHLDSVYGFSEWMYRAGFHFKDIAGKKNFWRVGATSLWINPFSTPAYYSVTFDIGDYLTSDYGRDGENISYFTNSFQLTPDDSSNFYISLYSVDESYYTFHKEADLAGNDYGNPFSEPVVLIGNIEGGLGIFSAFNKKVYSFNLQKL